MLNEFSRTELLIGKEAMQRLYNARVAVFGIGGVGGYVVEALARSGVGAFDLIDDDKVCLTNINRQIIATRKTIGKYKVDVMEERVHSINPEALVTVHKCFYLPCLRLRQSGWCISVPASWHRGQRCLCCLSAAFFLPWSGWLYSFGGQHSRPPDG